MSGDGQKELADWNRRLLEARTGGVQLEGQLNEMATQMRSMSEKTGIGSAKLSQFGAAMQTLATVQIGEKLVGLTGDMLKISGEYEKTMVSFEVMLGSAEKAKAVMKDLNEFAVVTPYEPKEVNAAANALLQFQVKQKDLIPVMRMVGDVASGVGKDYTELARLYGKMNALGKADNEMLQQVPVLYGEIAKVMGLTGDKANQTVFDMASAGRITSAHVAQAFKRMTSEGGVFYGMMDKQSRTWIGLMSTLQGNIDNMKLALGNMLATALKPVVDKVGTFFGWLVENQAILAVLKVAFIALIPIVGVFLVQSLYSAITALGIFNVNMLIATAPIAAVIAAIMALLLIFEDLYVWATGGDSLIGEWLEDLLGPDKAGMVKEEIKNLIEIIKNAFAMLITGGGEFFKWASATFGPLMTALKPLLANVVIPILGYLIKFQMTLYTIFYTIIGGGIAIATVYIKGLVELFTKLVTNVTNFTFEIYEGAMLIKDYLLSITGIGSFIDSIGTRVMGALKSLRGTIMDFMKDILPPAVYKFVASMTIGDKIEARAVGGPVESGRTYLVGEKGPELFSPSGSGTIIPNAGSAGGKSVNITISPVININGNATRDDANAMIDAVVRRIEEMIVQAGIMEGLEVI